VVDSILLCPQSGRVFLVQFLRVPRRRIELKKAVEIFERVYDSFVQFSGRAAALNRAEDHIAR